MAVDGLSSVNTSTLKVDVFVVGKEEFTDAVLLDAVTGYTPVYGDVLVIDKSDSSKHDRYDYDFVSTSDVTKSLTGNGYAFENTSLIDPNTLKVWAGSAIGTDSAALTMGTDFSFDGAIPANIVVDSASITASAALSFEFVEENAAQEIKGIIYEVDDTDTANQTLRFKTSCAALFSGLGVDGTATTALKATLKKKLKDMNIETVEG